MWVLIGDLDYMSDEKPIKDVFEKREWIVLTHHGWDDKRNILWYGPADNDDAKVNGQVVCKTKIRLNDPRSVRVYTDMSSLASQILLQLGSQILLQRDWDEYRTRHGLSSQHLDYGSVICKAFEYIISATARAPQTIEWYSSYQALEDLVGRIKASQGWQASDSWGRQGIHMATQRLLFGLHGASIGNPLQNPAQYLHSSPRLEVISSIRVGDTGRTHFKDSALRYQSLIDPLFSFETTCSAMPRRKICSTDRQSAGLARTLPHQWLERLRQLNGIGHTRLLRISSDASKPDRDGWLPIHTAGKEKDDFFFTTDLGLTAAEVIGGFVGRWSIEDTFKNTKQFIGGQEPQTWKRKGPERAAALSLWIYSAIWLWYLGQKSKRRYFFVQPWYPGKSAPSFADALSCLRRVLCRKELNLCSVKGSYIKKISSF